MPTTNLLAMPLCKLVVETGTNEDWIDSIEFLVAEENSQIEDLPQLDIRGIEFEMEVRRSAPDHEVVVNASTDDGSILVGRAPNYGFLIINVDIEEMKLQQPGVYVADIVGKEITGPPDNRVLVAQRVVVTMDLTIMQGITR